MKKLLVMLFASAFALTAFAQAPKSDTAPQAQTSAEKKDDKKAARAKARADRKAAKADRKAAKADRKAAKAKAKADKNAETK